MTLRQRARSTLPLGVGNSSNSNNNNNNNDDDGFSTKPPSLMTSLPRRSRFKKTVGMNLWTKVYLPVIWGMLLLMGCTHLFLGGHSSWSSTMMAATQHQHRRQNRLSGGRKLLMDTDNEIQDEFYEKLEKQREETRRHEQKARREIENHIKSKSSSSSNGNDKQLRKQREQRKVEQQRDTKEMKDQIQEELHDGIKKKVKGQTVPSAGMQFSTPQIQEDQQYHPSASQAKTMIEPREWTKQCRQKILSQSRGRRSKEESMRLIEDLAECAEATATHELVALNKEIAFQAKTRLQISGQLENYTCADPHSAMSPDVSTHTWTMPHGFKDGNITRTVHVKHDRPSSQIHVIENFVDEEECQGMEDAAQKSLHRATVADGKGGSRVSDNRKAMQAGIRVPWHHEAEGHAIARLSRRVYDYTNHVLGLNIDEHGQEDLMSIQYFGRGRDDEHPDRYMPHCDGDCSGLPHKSGTRMATMVIYCKVPTVGGSTNFRNAGVHVKPVKGAAVFFSYIDPETMLTDNRLTEHSGCPVYEGEKKIVTQWVRLGVDRENPWTSFNTLGIKIKDAERQ